ncbi:Pimeloyl-ACP methyl ester carboxylesterase [Nonomuraea solani]|uniref:Pimeloyl-ACP methyl ester carboxylesterase n=1 Tax=Nonomuraea solani TaxID=1144553 RepID=A0A1H6EZ40_9ACTN|nr:epoxide hydrolase family protein [Nonomuraea solani]SEH03160.1 Pimeloyl-ACP methyl ester carboxylesterase [Nonomuraea solani]
MTAEIQSFSIDIPQADLESLADRLRRTRWPDELPGVEWTHGIPLKLVRELAEYWCTGYDWRAAEARLNGFPQFITEIDGQRIHFLHVESERDDAIPLLITHGYPSSFAEFEKVIPELLDRGFHVVIPSLPGFGFSTPVRESGWAMGRTARAWVELMARLGYERYGVHGGDVGAGVSGAVGGLDGEHVIGIHVVTDPYTAAATATFMPWIANQLNPDDPVDKLALDRIEEFRRNDSGYLAIQNTRPQTMGYGLTDSPVMQLAWIAESFELWTDLPIDRDQLLTNISLYWFTGSGVSAARFLYEQAHSQDWGTPPTAPQGYSVFGADPTARRLIGPAEDAHWVEHGHGRHFPAMEAPAQLAEDLSAFFDGLR